MNKTYLVIYFRNRGIETKKFDDLLKMWEFVIGLKKDETVTVIEVHTAQEVYRKG